LEMGGPNVLQVSNTYLGAYGQDVWRMSDRVTLNAGVRWEPYFGQNVRNDAIVIFKKENFDQGIRSKVFVNAPPGLIYPWDPGINSPRAQQWNVMIEQQLGASWGVSASYLGSYSDRLWAQTALNPGVYLGLGPCTLNTATGAVSYPVCSTTSNLDQRRRMSL